MTYHVIDGGGQGVVDESHMAMAIAFLRVIRRHASALFNGILTVSPAIELARALAGAIVAGSLTEVSRNAFSQHCRAWRGAADREQREAVQVLVDASWIGADEETGHYGGWARRWLVNPAVHEKYAEHGRQRLEARREVVEIIAGTGG